MTNYLEKIENLIKNNNIVSDNEIEDIISQVEDELHETGAGIESVQVVLSLMEHFSLFDFGFPGGLTHHIESFFKYGYEELLLQSINRMPTNHTVWLLNRVINGVDKERATIYSQTLLDISNNELYTDDVRKTAKDFYHNYTDGIK